MQDDLLIATKAFPFFFIKTKLFLQYYLIVFFVECNKYIFIVL
ncbi:hypothetical protein ANH9381_0087 [Aggregatibacter actinomycetemcomitans ANH9381]|nr:hypothetical protein ANH9381_0087 [Aggregatibacter actinomycetemcomitans ANH9381]